MIIGLSGYAQSGKDEVAKILIEEFGFERVAFADAIRDLLYLTNPILNELAGDIQHAVDHRGWDEIKQIPAVRKLLQSIGVAAREVLGKNVWVVAALRKMEDDSKDYVITDVRFENEASMIKYLGGVMWRISRDGVTPVNSHISENELDGYKFDQILKNEGSLDDLRELVRKRKNFSLNAN
jgi:hypothetical protein